MFGSSFDLTTASIFLFSAYLGWNIGANDAANCVGPAVGAGLISLRKGLLLVAASVFLGAILQGSKTIETISGIASLGNLDLAVISVLVGASIVLFLLTLRGIPVSTTFVVLGAIVGISLLIGIPVNWAISTTIFIFGLLTPIVSLCFSYMIYRFIQNMNRRWPSVFRDNWIRLILLISCVFMAYSLGANNVGNAVGLLVEKKLIMPIVGGFIGGFAIAIGALTMGKRVVLTVGKEISILDPLSAFAASMGAGICLYTLALLGIPTSSSFAIVGAVAGVGISHGTNLVNRQTIRKIIEHWFICPVLAGLMSILVFLILKLI